MTSLAGITRGCIIRELKRRNCILWANTQNTSSDVLTNGHLECMSRFGQGVITKSSLTEIKCLNHCHQSITYTYIYIYIYTHTHTYIQVHLNKLECRGKVKLAKISQLLWQWMFVAYPPCEGCQWLSCGQLSDQQSSPWLCSLVNQTERPFWRLRKPLQVFGVDSADWHVTIF